MRPAVKPYQEAYVPQHDGPSNERVEKTESQSQRDTATIVKGWISEWQQRRRSPQRPR